MPHKNENIILNILFICALNIVGVSKILTRTGEEHKRNEDVKTACKILFARSNGNL
jgi:uncharacterized membrane protein